MKMIGRFLIVSLVVALVLPVFGGTVSAQTYTVDYPVTAMSTIRGPVDGGNEYDTYANVMRWRDELYFHRDNHVWMGDCMRTIVQLGDQSGAGEVEKVELFIYYKDRALSPWVNPSGKAVWINRITRTPVMSQVSWMNWKSGSAWTSQGGDYTTYQNVQWSHAGSYGYVTIDVTDMALSQWDLGKDLYAMVGFRYNTEGNDSLVYYGDRLDADTGKRPYFKVTYLTEPEPPEISVEVDKVGDVWVDVEVTPKLYGFESANITVEVSARGAGNWTLVENYGLVANDAEVVVRVTGLTSDTAYDVRGKLVYDDEGDQTVYSPVVEFSTVAWVMPVLYVTEDGTDWGSMDVTVGYTGNDSTESVRMALRYREKVWTGGAWTYSGYVTRTAVDSSWSMTIEGLRTYGETYQVEGVFEIDNEVFYSDVIEVVMLERGSVTLNLTDKGGDWAEFEVEWYLEEGGSLTYIEVEVTGGGQVVVSDRITVGLDVDGDDTLVVMGLTPGVEYFAKAIGKHPTGEYNAYLLPYGTTFYTTDIVVLPEVVTVRGEWDAISGAGGRVLRLYGSVILNDAEYITKVGYFEYREKDTATWKATTTVAVVAEGEFFVEVPEILVEYGTEYEVRAKLNYTVGTVTGEMITVWIPERGVWVGHLTVERVGRDVQVKAYVDTAGGATWGVVLFKLYDEDELVVRTRQVGVTGDGWVVWRFESVEEFPVCGTAEYGTSVTTKVCESGASPGGPVHDYLFGWMNDVFGGSGRLWGGFLMLLGLVISIGAGGLLAWKLRGSGGWQMGLFASFGLALFFGAIGWFPVWIILLLTMMLGLGLLWSFKGVSAPG